jgi:hypothetical protein
MALSKNTTILIAAGIVVLGLVAYFLWMRPSGEEIVSTTGFGAAGEAQATFLTLGAQLGPIGFDASILSDPRFTKLVDIKTVIVPEAGGRTDPFAPLPGAAAKK